jgi:hypothetical protein
MAIEITLRENVYVKIDSHRCMWNGFVLPILSINSIFLEN